MLKMLDLMKILSFSCLFSFFCLVFFLSKTCLFPTKSQRGWRINERTNQPTNSCSECQRRLAEVMKRIAINPIKRYQSLWKRSGETHSQWRFTIWEVAADCVSRSQHSSHSLPRWRTIGPTIQLQKHQCPNQSHYALTHWPHYVSYHSFPSRWG